MIHGSSTHWISLLDWWIMNALYWSLSTVFAAARLDWQLDNTIRLSVPDGQLSRLGVLTSGSIWSIVWHDFFEDVYLESTKMFCYFYELRANNARWQFVECSKSVTPTPLSPLLSRNWPDVYMPTYTTSMCLHNEPELKRSLVPSVPSMFQRGFSGIWNQFFFFFLFSTMN